MILEMDYQLVLEKMKRNKILIRINKLEDINDLKKLGISNFLFPLDEFSIGYNSFKIDELLNIDGNVYLLLNRVLDNNGIDDFKKNIDKISFVKGIIYEDLGIYQILKDKEIPLIWNQNHFAVNTSSINYWLEKVSSVVISNELEKDELNNILDRVNKPIILPILGLNMAMYSRRYLISFYNEFKGLKQIKKAILKTNDDNEFIAMENNYGTVLFYKKYYNLIKEIDKFNDKKILFYYIDPNMLSINDIKDILNGKVIDEDNRFYKNKTVYRIGDLDD